MMDIVFGEVKREDDYGWKGKQTIDFGGNMCTVELLIHEEDESKITQRQKKAFKCFMEKWPKLQTDLIEALIKYYNEEERFSYGPDDEEE